MDDSPTVLITGAAGFIGSRVAEVLHCSNVATVRATVRRWGSAARIGRLPVEIVPCDITLPEQVNAAIQGVSSIVHCAVGTGETNIEGTRNLLEAALQTDVDRFVHISTVDVYGEVSGDASEVTPLSSTGGEYRRTKIEAEKLCWAYHARGLPLVVLRPTIVYGPFSASWTIEFAERLISRRWSLAEKYCNGLCNLVYVDDLIGAILLALRNQKAVGEAFNINGPDRVCWNDYFQELNAEMGLPRLRPQKRTASLLKALLIMPVRKFAKFLLHSFEGPIMAIYQRSNVAKRLMRAGERMIKNTPTTGEFNLYSRDTFYPTTKANQMLGYEPQVHMKEGVAWSVAWLRHHKYLNNGESERSI